MQLFQAFVFEEVKGYCTIYVLAKNKGADQLRGTAQLKCTLVIAYAKNKCSHEAGFTELVSFMMNSSQNTRIPGHPTSQRNLRECQNHTRDAVS